MYTIIVKIIHNLINNTFLEEEYNLVFFCTEFDNNIQSYLEKIVFILILNKKIH